MLKCFSSGRKIGTKMTMISVHSSGQPSTKMIACDRIMNCNGVRLNDSTHCSTSCCPPRIANTPENKRRPDEQPAHHGGGLRGQEDRLLDALPVEGLAPEAHQKRAGGADGGRFGARS